MKSIKLNLLKQLNVTCSSSQPNLFWELLNKVEGSLVFVYIDTKRYKYLITKKNS